MNCWCLSVSDFGQCGVPALAGVGGGSQPLSPLQPGLMQTLWSSEVDMQVGTTQSSLLPASHDAWGRTCMPEVHVVLGSPA
jgi:hypothetical protein